MRVVGIFLILLSVPLFVALLRSYPQYRRWAYFGIGLLPFTTAALNLDVALVSWAGWTGYAFGIIISLLDALALAIIIISRSPLAKLPFRTVIAAYFLAASLSVFLSSLWMSSAFYVFQLLRVFLVFVAVASFAGNYSSLRWLTWGLAVGAIYQCVIAIDQKLSGIIQASGTMGHQNLLGLMLHFVTLPLLALLLAGERSKLTMAGVLGALIAVALGASRGSLAFVALGLVILVCLSLIRGSTIHKWKVIGLGLLMAAMVVPLALDTLFERFGDGEFYAGPDGERQAFERAAKAIWADYPMGVGVNQYVVVANTEGYSERAGVTWNSGSRSAKVHNMYLLAAAETGWLGILTLAAMLIWPIFKGLSFCLRNRLDPRGDFILGSTVALVVLSMHGFYEWVFFLIDGQYMFGIALGIIAGNLRQARHDTAEQATLFMTARIPHAAGSAPTVAVSVIPPTARTNFQ